MREIPRPDEWRVEVWRHFLRTHAHVIRSLEQERADQIPLGWYDVLLQLVEAPQHRLRMAELAERVLLSRSGLTRLVDRLAAEGLVRRERSEDDARGTYTVLTQAGVERFRRAVPGHLAAVQERFLARFTDAELRRFDVLLTHVVE